MQIQKISKNIKFSFVNYIVINLLKFLVRIIFIKNLSIEYLGINGLFTNVLAMLSLAELGIGPAIVYSLYKPLAISDKQIVKSIMDLFRKVYISVGSIIFIVGMSLTPWIKYLIKDTPAIDNLEIFYIIFLLNTSVSYFWSYKRNLLIADQKQYFVNIYQAIIQSVVAILQIILLFFIPNYWGFILLMLLGTIFENILISHKANKEYPYLNGKSIPINKNIKEKIIKNTKAMIMHKIGGIIVFSSANIVLSKFVGLVAVGIYSNYFMVLSAMNAFSSKIFESMTASVGNAMVIDKYEEKVKYFKLIEFITAFQASLISIGLYILFNPFIKLWLGEDFLFDELTVTCIVISFYLTYMRKAVLMFRDACGLFWYDRYKPIAEAIINIVASIYLTIFYGTIGVIYGSIISTILTCFWIEPYILFRYGINLTLKKYFFNYLLYTLVTIFIAIILKNIYQSIFFNITVINFILSMVSIIFCVIILWMIIFQYKYEGVIFKNIILKKFNIK